MGNQARCSGCAFAQPIKGGVRLEWECRRHAPPAAHTHMYSHSKAVWPHINPGDWCGEHQPTETLRVAIDK
jgi:hypothetical protein